MMGSYNYLGLANNEEVKKGAIDTINKYGSGSGGVRLLTGTMSIHQALEKELSAFVGSEDSLTIASGYGANVGIIPGFINLLGFGKSFLSRRAVIFSDEYNHASIVDGCKLSNAELVIYRHNDVNELERKISKYKKYRKLIVTDGVFSMDGDIAHLDKILDLATAYTADVMVDDAHAIGVLGDTGAGTAEHFGRKGAVHLNMGTFSKGLGVSGGFLSGTSELIAYMRVACRSYMFSDSLSPGVVGAVRAVIHYIQKNKTIIKDLMDKSNYFRLELNKAGFNTYASVTQIIPIHIGDEDLAMRFAEELYKAGAFAPTIRWPAVPKGMARIRFAMSAEHTYDTINKALEIIIKVGKELSVI
jgi:8-amino-7-oxononanoate synthase